MCSAEEEAVNAWEYKVAPVSYFRHQRTEKVLNELGEQGWELVVVQPGSDPVGIFKRPKAG